MKDYIKIARPDHWIKNLFIFPGTLFALLLVGWKGSYGGLAGIALVSFFCTCMIASANYVINEWLDARFDKYHPTKKKRPVVQNTMSGKIVAAEYAVLAAVGQPVRPCWRFWLTARPNGSRGTPCPLPRTALNKKGRSST